MMNIDDLQKIQTVDVPPFLFTRIQQKIENAKHATLPTKTAWALSLTLLIIVFFNLNVIVKNRSKKQTIETYIQSMNLTTDNTLYHE